MNANDETIPCIEPTDVPPDKIAKTMCAVTIDGKFMSSDDFVAILTKSNGGTTLLFQTDALTLGIAEKLVKEAFDKSIAACPKEEQENIRNILYNSDEVQDE